MVAYYQKYIILFSLISLGIVFVFLNHVNVHAQTVLPGVDDEQSGQEPKQENKASLTYKAETIYDTGAVKADSDISNLVILMPEKKLINESFLPKDSTIVEGTTVFWYNGQKGTTHGIEVKDKDGETILTNSSIPFMNATKYQFDDAGKYSFSILNDSGVGSKGTITVIKNADSVDNLSTNATTPTLGMLVAPAGEEDFWKKHLHSLGFNLVDSYKFKYSGTNGETSVDEGQASDDSKGKDHILYVYTQKLDKDSTVVYRVGTKIKAVEDQLAD